MSSSSQQQQQQRAQDRALDAALKKASTHALQYEYQMKDLESKLAENLSNFRAIDSILQDAFTTIQTHSRRAKRASTSHIPHTQHALSDSERVLGALGADLPVVQAQVHDIRAAYDSGRRKAQALVADLTWLNTDFATRWRRTVFTSRTPVPVSWRWRAGMRAVFACICAVALFGLWIVGRGALRAHRERLVWGERLMS